jgi:hypothetical protein
MYTALSALKNRSAGCCHRCVSGFSDKAGSLGLATGQTTQNSLESAWPKATETVVILEYLQILEINVLTLTPRNGEQAGLTMPELAEAEEAG